MTLLYISQSTCPPPPGWTQASMFGAGAPVGASRRLDWPRVRSHILTLPRNSHFSYDVEGDFSDRMVSCDPLMLDDAALTMQRIRAARPDLSTNFYGYPSRKNIDFTSEYRRHAEESFRAGQQWTFTRRAHSLLQSLYIQCDWDQQDLPFYYLDALTIDLQTSRQPYGACLFTRTPETHPTLGLLEIPEAPLLNWVRGILARGYSYIWHWNEVRSWAQYTQDPNGQATHQLAARNAFGTSLLNKDRSLNEAAIQAQEAASASYLDRIIRAALS